MCLAIPMRLVAVRDLERGVAEIGGVHCDIDLSLVEKPVVGDYLIVHTGFAIEKLDPEEADGRIELFQSMGRQWRRNQRMKG